MEKKKKLIAISATIFMIALFGAMSYAFFTTDVDNSKATSAQLTTGTMELTFRDNDESINEKLMFGESITKKFVIENTGSLDSSLSIDWDELVNTYMNGSLTYKLEYSDNEDGEYQTLIETSNVPVSTSNLTQTMAGEISVPSKSTYYYNLIVTLENLSDVDQTDDVNAVFHTKFSVGQPLKYRYYTLVLDTAGGTSGDITGITEYQLQNLDTLNIPEPTRVGYTFAGWQIEGTSSSMNDDTFTMGLTNSKITAKWEANSYTVSVDADGGDYTGETSITLDYDSSIELSTPTKEGYTFNGWMVSGGTLQDNTFTLTDASNVSITASWSVNNYDYTIIHRQMNVSGSGYSEIDRETGTLNYGDTLSPTPKSYIGFKSPAKKSITIGVNESSNVITYDYERNEYTLTIDADGGNYSGDKTVKMLYGAKTTIATPTKEGHTFTGWDVPSGSLSGTIYTIGASNVTLTATWEANDYKYIVYHNQMNTDGNGYTLVSADTNEGSAAYGSTVTPNVNTYTGFTSPSRQSLTIKVDTNTPPTLNVVNYKYSRNQYTLTIKPNGGKYNNSTADTSKKMYYNTGTTILTPSREGYTFNGWTKSAGTLNGSTFTIGDSNAILTAEWTVNSYAYTVNHYKMNVSGSGYTLESTENKTANYGTSVTPSVKSYTGFTAPSKKSITIKVDTTQNVVDYYYTRNKYQLIITIGDGTYTGEEVPTTGVYYGASINLGTPSAPAGYSFNNWTATNGTIKDNTYTMKASHDTIMANYTPNKYVITYNANGGTFGDSTTKSVTVTYGSLYGRMVEPSYEGYTFSGWYTKASGGTPISEGSRVTTTENQTLYAHWTQVAFNIAQAVTAIENGKTPYGVSEKDSSGEYGNNGVYAAEDNYGTSYFYRGSNSKNIMSFAGLYWRIIRVNGDGSVRMIYHIDNNQPGITNIPWNTNSDDAKYVGYMYGGANGTASTSKEGAQTNETSSNIKTQLEAWYTTNIETPGYEKYLADVIFCNDRTITDGPGYGQGTTYYSEQTDDITFVCPTNNVVNANNDWFTVEPTTKNMGNGHLQQPVALITRDEARAAGIIAETESAFGFNSKYTYLNANYTYWTMTPRSRLSGKFNMYIISRTEEVTIYGDTIIKHHIGKTATDDTLPVAAPVINLSAEYAKQLIGNGSSSNPYRLS